MLQILLKTAQELKRTELIFSQILISLIFGRILRFYEKMNKAQMKQRKLATILDKSVGTFSYVFFKVLKSFHNQELTFRTLPVQ